MQEINNEYVPRYADYPERSFDCTVDELDRYGHRVWGIQPESDMKMY